MEQLRHRLQTAIETHDIERLDEIVLYLTFKQGWDYWQVFEFAHEVSGIGVDTWDELLRECDEYSIK